MASKRARSPSPNTSPIFRSSQIDEQTSTFIGAFSPSLSIKTLQSLTEFKSASHRIAAWRKPSRQKSLMPNSKVIYDLDHDDDGERWAGSRLQSILADMQVEGVVVVARWYGGQNIGPIRFTHIETCAKEAIWKWKKSTSLSSQAASIAQAAKKIKTHSEDATHKELTQSLQERDFNIFALRKLLADKKAKLDGELAAPPTPQKPQDYEKMTLAALQRVDKARDATIAFILKQIDKVEEELKLVEALDDGMDDLWDDLDSQDKHLGPPSTPPEKT